MGHLCYHRDRKAPTLDMYDREDSELEAITFFVTGTSSGSE
jgi:hypothetical protein